MQSPAQENQNKFWFSVRLFDFDWRRKYFRSEMKKKNIFSFCISLTYSYLSPLEKVLPLKKTQKKFWFSFRLFVPLQLMKRLVTYLMAAMVLATMVTGCVTEGRRMAMRQGLDSINAVNRSGKPFTVQDVEPYVEFFDDHGEPIYNLQGQRLTDKPRKGIYIQNGNKVVIK